VDDDVLGVGVLERGRDGRELDELGARADDADDLHEVILPDFCCWFAAIATPPGRLDRNIIL
jgi:hypothetical protein